jgi:ankyrin repeat protein
MHPDNLDDIYEQNPGKEALLDAYWKIITDNGIEGCGKELAFKAAAYVHPEALSLLFEAGVDPHISDSRNGRTLLHYAALRNPYNRKYLAPVEDTERTVKLLLEKKVNVLTADSWENKVCYLHAAEHGNWRFVCALAQEGVRLNRTGKDGNNGIHTACYYAGRALESLKVWERNLKEAEDERSRENAQKERDKDLEKVEDYYSTVKAFIDAGLDIDEKNGEDCTALDIAIRSGAKKIAALLDNLNLERTNGRSIPTEHETMLHEGALSGEEAEGDPQAALRLAAGGMDLIQALLQEDYEAMEALVKLGAHVDAVSGKLYEGMTALGLACAMLDSRAAEILLEAGADPNYRDARGCAAAAHAFSSFPGLSRRSQSKEDFQKFARTMLDRGFEINGFVNDDSDTILNLACKNCGVFYDNTPFVIQEFLDAGSDINISNRFGETPLMHACKGDAYMEAVELLLLEKGADTAAKDRDGNTVLHYASMNNSKTGARSLAENLLDYGADAKAVNNKGQSALELAAERDNEPLVKLLLKKI